MNETASRILAGRRVLVVEDLYLIAAELSEQLRRMGAEVAGPAPDLAQGRALIEAGPLDAALLDVNLEGELVFPLAELLAAKRTPFIFLTGYDGDVLPPPWRDRPQLTKPVDMRDLRAGLIEALAGSSGA